MKKVTCPNCNNYGSPPTMEESMKAFGIEEDQNIGAFRQRGQMEGIPFWVCNKCESGLIINTFGEPDLVVGERLMEMKGQWEAGTGNKF